MKTSQSGSRIVPPLLALGWWGASKPQETETSAASESKKMSELEHDIKMADELFDDNKTQEAYDLLIKHKDVQNAEVEWRLARACRVLAEKSLDEGIKKQITYEALEHAKLALSLDDKNFACHKVNGIFLTLHDISVEWWNILMLSQMIKQCDLIWKINMMCVCVCLYLEGALY